MHLGVVRIGITTIHQKVLDLAFKVHEDYGDRDLTICIVLKGAMIFASDLIRYLPPSMNVDITFIQAISYFGKESLNVHIDFTYSRSEIEGKDVLIVEDIVDTGKTTYAVLKKIEERNPKSIKLCSLLRKPVQEVVYQEVDYLGFEIPNKFVVGYGMDYNGKYRNLPSIHDLEEQSIPLTPERHVSKTHQLDVPDEPEEESTHPQSTFPVQGFP